MSRDSVEQMLFPTALLLTAILIVVGLGIFQRLSVDVETRVGEKDKRDTPDKKTAEKRA